MRICSIASGSSGNCIYVGSDATHLLVDVGISGKRTEAGLKELGLTMREIDGILITHEHADHIAGLGVLERKYEVPVYATRGTIEAIKRNTSVGKIPEDLFCPVQADEKIIIKDLSCNPMRISHDAAEPVAYRISHGRKKVGIVTDLGNYNDYTVESLKGMDALLLEANHDVNMLQVGPYPYYLKQRILGDRGHLSNERAGQLLRELMHEKLQAVVLGHLSKENNLPELAYEAVRVEVTMAGVSKMEDEKPAMKLSDFPMYVAARSEPSGVIHIA
ncbi:MBL fold metallo-hydrolase [Parablautia intestinalis]|uniref:MBL fold metallo-hydrolase n=1 Tax=Parablautia intestinalis TaxID=2320100 RepID=A0A3A9ANJ0_9FIRM|nr:MBL fold metallo-hydrolase [Parablautia intestinalis]RKI92888.1 MBL fold metallo-hydrolase [Parablautia intestinalis]